MHLGTYLALTASAEQQLVTAFDQVAQTHHNEPDVYQTCGQLAGWSRENLAVMQPSAAFYEAPTSQEPERRASPLFEWPRSGSVELLRDLQNLWLLASQVHMTRLVLSKGAQALHDDALALACLARNGYTKRQLSWLLGQLKEFAPQTLAVAV